MGTQSNAPATLAEAQEQRFIDRRTSPFRDWLHWSLTTPRVTLCGGFIVLLCLAAIAAPLIADPDHAQLRAGFQHLGPLENPPFGTDEFGRDIYSRLVFGARITLTVSIASVMIAMTFGTVFGMAAAYFGGLADSLLMRTCDAILAFPPILLGLFVIAFLGASVTNVILVIGVLYIPRFQRIAHSTTLSVQENEYIEAYKAIGARAWRILLKGVLPNIFAPLIVTFSLAMGTAILLESSLSFLGLGVHPSVPSWGRMINNAMRHMHNYQHAIVFPAILISLTVLAFNVLGDALRDRLDPRLRR
jgi:peptide/nickel transport system permease protein